MKNEKSFDIAFVAVAFLLGCMSGAMIGVEVASHSDEENADSFEELDGVRPPCVVTPPRYLEEIRAVNSYESELDDE